MLINHEGHEVTRRGTLTTEPTELHGERHRDLLIAQRLHGIELGRAGCRIQAGQQADQEGESERENHEPPRYRPEVLRRKALARKIDIRSEVDYAADQPSQGHAENSSEQSHGAGFGEK